MDVKEFMLQVELFEGLNDQEIDKVIDLSRLDECVPGDLIWREGDDAEDLCLVSEGQVELRYEMPGRESTREQAMIIISKGNAFGWSALVPPHKLTLSAFGGDKGCSYYRINGSRLVSLFDAHSHIGYICFRNLTRVIAKRFHAMEDEIARAAGMDVMHNW